MRRLAVELPLYTMLLSLDRLTNVNLPPHEARAGSGSNNEGYKNLLTMIYNWDLGTKSIRPHVLSLYINVYSILLIYHLNFDLQAL